MAKNKNRESSIGKTIQTTLLSIEQLDAVALDAKYDFFVVSCNGGEDYTPVISDPGEAIADGRICGTCAEYRKRYIMFKKHPDNFEVLRNYVDEKGRNFLIDRTSAACLKEDRLNILLNILSNSVTHELEDWMQYNNLDGNLYLTYGSWSKGKHIQTLEVSIRQTPLGHVLKLSATMFSKISSFGQGDMEKVSKRPMYLLPKGETRMRRTFKYSRDAYVKGNSGKNNAKVPYIHLYSREKLKLSKNYIFDTVIKNFNAAYEGCVKIGKSELRIEDYLEPDGISVKDFMKNLSSKIEATEYSIVNTVPESEDAVKLQEQVIKIMKERFGKEVQISNEPVDGRFNIRIIHDKSHYMDNNLTDQYRSYPDKIVQHLTVENCIDEGSVDANIINVLIKELFIKECVSHRMDLIGDWKHRGFKGDVIFLKRVKTCDKPRRYTVYKLTMHENGGFEICALDDNDPILFETVDVWADNTSNSDTEHVIIYNGSICAIENSNIVPVIDNDYMEDTIVKHEKEKKKQTESQDPNENGKKRVSRRDGEGPTGYRTYNNALYAMTDIQLLSFKNNLLYMCGHYGSNIDQKYDKAPNIRLVRCIKGNNIFGDVLELMNVPFVRYGQTTVYPYPFKFISEFIEAEKQSTNGREERKSEEN